MPEDQGENIMTPMQPKELEKKAKIEEIRKDYQDPNTFVPDNDKLSEFISLICVEKKSSKQKERKKELSQEIASMYGLENGIWIANISYSKNYPTLANMRRKIITDYDCRTSIEFMIADRIVANYWRTMRNDTLLNFYIENEDGSFSINQLKINMIREFNRGLERAGRQLNADIVLLKELKQPKLNIKVNTENAYIAQNQQVVNTDHSGSKSVSKESLDVIDLGTK